MMWTRTRLNEHAIEANPLIGLTLLLDVLTDLLASLRTKAGHDKMSIDQLHLLIFKC